MHSEHIDEESLERYALGRSLPSESEWIEEHLPRCGTPSARSAAALLTPPENRGAATPCTVSD